jgi:small RNA 2'-O-methyltransferase
VTFDAEVLGWDETSTPLHEERLDAVMAYLRLIGAETVLDLGCGSGALLERLLTEPRLRRIVGVDSSPGALLAAEHRLTWSDGTGDERLSLREGSVTTVGGDLAGFDAAVLVETIEHLDPRQLSMVERSLFTRLRPGHVLITTPNHEYNVLHGFEPGEYRHPHHRFEWDRPRFERWARGVGLRNGYSVAFQGVGPANMWYGSSTQMAAFQRSPD